MSPFSLLRKELPNILPIFTPLLISQYAGIAQGVVDTAMISRLGIAELGGVAIGVSIWVPLQIFILGVLYGMLMLIARLHGANDTQGTVKMAHQGAWLGLFMGFCAAVIMHILSYSISWFGSDAALVTPAGEYLRMIAYGMPMVGILYALRFFCEGQQIIIPITIMSVIMVGINTILNYGLIFGNLGMPAMGIKGCGLATVISWVCFFLMVATYIRLSQSALNRSFFQTFFLPNIKILWQILKIGIPIGLGITSEFLVFTAITLFIATSGAIATAAHQICFSAMMLLFATPTALAVATSIRIGGLVGKKDVEGARKAIGGIMILSFLMGLFFTGVMTFGAGVLISIFTTDPLVVPLAISVLFIAAVFQLSDSLQVCLNGILRSAGDTAVPFVITSITYWLFALPLGYVLSGMPLPTWLGWLSEALGSDLGIRGWWWAMTISISLVAILFAFRVRKIFGKDSTFLTKTVEN